jgi:hypothetical protein
LQVLPGMSIFDLSQTCFGGARVYLSAHFRCVPTCIAFSNERFYNHKLLPRRLPPRSQRLEPPLLDVFVRNGKKGARASHARCRAPATCTCTTPCTADSTCRICEGAPCATCAGACSRRI